MRMLTVRFCAIGALGIALMVTLGCHGLDDKVANDIPELPRSLSAITTAEVRVHCERVRSAMLEGLDVALQCPPGFSVEEYGSEEVPYLLHSLNSPESHVRMTAYCLLSKMSNRSYGRWDDFGDEGYRARRGRREAIQKWRAWWSDSKGMTRVEWLQRDIQSNVQLRRENAAMALAHVSDPAAIAVLRAAARDPELLHFAADALAYQGDICAVPYLIKLYSSDDNTPFLDLWCKHLIRLTGVTPTNLASVAEWENWWEKNKSLCREEAEAVTE